MKCNICGGYMLEDTANEHILESTCINNLKAKIRKRNKKIRQLEKDNNKLRYDAEELECVKKWLDECKAPRKCPKTNQDFSVIGRITWLINNAIQIFLNFITKGSKK